MGHAAGRRKTTSKLQQRMLERSKDYPPLFAFMERMKNSYHAIKLLRKKMTKDKQTETMNLLSGQQWVRMGGKWDLLQCYHQ